MRNLLLFLTRYYAFFMFLGLELLCAYLIFSYNHFQRSRFLSSAGVLSANVLNARSTMTDYFSLTEKNKALADQNADLLKKMFNEPPIRYVATDDSTLIDSTANIVPLYEFIPAKIIDKTTLRLHNYITINKGEEQGVLPQMGVVGPRGVVGIVHKVSDNYATVMTLLHKGNRLSAKLKKNDYFGSLTWDGQSEFVAQLNDIPTNIKVEIGDTIVSSGYSDFFPDNILVGTVSNVDRESGSNFHTIQLKLSTIFRSIGHVYIIDFKDKEEVETLKSDLLDE